MNKNQKERYLIKKIYIYLSLRNWLFGSIYFWVNSSLNLNDNIIIDLRIERLKNH